MSGITTHVLDTARGRPAAGMRVALDVQVDDGWTPVGSGVTDTDGRVPGLVPEGGLRPGVHRMTFFTGDWFAAEGTQGFYPLGNGRLHDQRPCGPPPYPAADQPVRLQHLPGQLTCRRA
jgi:5-hydroxyisourate hydrolase